MCVCMCVISDSVITESVVLGDSVSMLLELSLILSNLFYKYSKVK